MGLPAAALLYIAITALLFHNLLAGITTHLYSDLGDPLLNTAILAWNATRLPLSEAWWNFPSFAPLPGVTSFTEHLLLTYPIASPIVWFTGNPVLAHNITFLAAMPLNGLAAFALARELLGGHGRRVRLQPDHVSGAAFIAGLAFAFAPYQSVHLSHLQQMTTFGMPVMLLWLHRYLRTGRRSALAGCGIGWCLTALANSALLIFFPVLLVLWAIWFGRGQWRRVTWAAASAAVASLPLIPLLWGYHLRHLSYGFVREYGEVRSFSADMVGLLGMYHRALSWRGFLPHDFEEGALFPGFAIAGLAVFAILCTRTRSTHPNIRARRLFLAFAVLTVIVLARVWAGPWGWTIGPLPLPPFRPYHLFTIGAILLLASVMLRAGFRRAWAEHDTVIFYAVAAVVMWLVALGPEPEWSTPWKALTYGPYALLYQLPGVSSVRVPARAWFPATLCLAVLSGFGAAQLMQQYARRARLIAAACALLIVWDGAFFDGTAAAPRPMRQGAIPSGATVLDLPIDEGFHSAVPQYRAVLGGYRTINGYSGYEPRHYTPLRRAIADLHPDALDSYRRAAPLYVIVRPGVDPVVGRWIASHPGAEHLFDLEDAKVYRLSRIPS